jgi:parallel beta-helix repeat protein
VLNVLDYGAIGDGVADDTADIQNALNDAAGQRAIVYIPAGSYFLTANLLVQAGTTILSSGYVFGTGHHRLIANFVSTDNFPGYTGNGDITIIGGTWDVKGQNCAADEGYNVMSFTHAANIHIERAVVRNVAWSHGIEFNAINNGKWVDCRAEGFIDTNTNPEVDRQKAEAFQIDMAAVGSTSLAPFDNTPCKNITVQNCYAGPSAELGTWGTLTGSHTGKEFTGVYYDNIKVLDCRADQGTLKYGIHGERWRDFIISRCTLNGTAGTSIFMDACIGGVIEDNIVRSAGSNGINLTTTSGTVVAENSINDAAAYCVYLNNADNCNITDNYLYGGMTAAVKLYTGTNATEIRANTIRKGNGAAVALINASGTSTKNYFLINDLTGYGTGASVIQVDSGTVVKTIPNNTNIGSNLA